MPTADIVPSRPTALPSRAFGMMAPTIAVVSASIAAAPRPCSARAMMSWGKDVARPQNNDATVKRATPPISSRRRPIMSPSRPALTISVVSFPLLLDRVVPLRAAIGTSVRAVIANPGPMALWGLIVAFGLAIGSIPALLGLIVVMPVLGHATWHLYRRVVAR